MISPIYLFPDDLKRHRSAVHNIQGGLFQCAHCKREFTRMDALRRHSKIPSGDLACCGLKSFPPVKRTNLAENFKNSSNWIHSVVTGSSDSSLSSIGKYETGSMASAKPSPIDVGGGEEYADLFDDLPDFYKLPKQPLFDDNFADMGLSLDYSPGLQNYS